MNTNGFFYPFDPTGAAPSNKIVGERQVINSPGIMDFFFIVPKAGPYFRDSLVLTLYPSGRQLAEGVDYVCTHQFVAATHSIGQGIYGSITFYDHTLTGTVGMTYQTIGGDWVVDENTILQVLANILLDPRITTWEQVVNVPYQFPPINHEYNIDDFVGADDVVDKLDGIRQALVSANSDTISGHILDDQNPHKTTKAQVGLDLVENFPLATASQAQVGTSSTAYMTPLRTAQAIQSLAWGRIDNHISDFANPHAVTKAQVGLGSVENLALASQTESEQGASNARYMTPLRTKDAITYQVGTAFATFAARRDNPNVVTKAQVGLGNVDNYRTATVAEAQIGTLSNAFVTPQLVSAAITFQVGDLLNNHLEDFANPHQVTAAQVGLGLVRNLTTATQSEAEAGVSNDVYMTPVATRYAIQTLADATVGTHAGLTNNPHQVTKAQVGLGNVDNFTTATQTEAFDGLSNTVFMTALRTKEAIQYQIGNRYDTFIARRDNPFQVTAAQVGTYTSATIDTLLAGKLSTTGVAANTTLAYGLNKGELLAEAQAQTSANSALLDGQTVGNIVDLALAGTSADSTLLGGQTKTQILSEYTQSGVLGAGQANFSTITWFPTAADPETFVDVRESWTRIAAIAAGVPFSEFKLVHISFMISGGNRFGVEGTPTVLATLTFDNDFWLTDGLPLVDKSTYQNLTGIEEGFVLQHRVVDIDGVQTCEIWLHNIDMRGALCVTDLTKRNLIFDTTPEILVADDLITVAPAGLVDFVKTVDPDATDLLGALQDNTALIASI